MLEQFARTLLLKDEWILFSPNMLVYVHTAEIFTAGNNVVMRFNENPLYTKTYSLKDLPDFNIDKELQILTAAGISHVMKSLIEYLAVNELTQNDLPVFHYAEYDKLNQIRGTLNTRQVITSQSAIEGDMVLLNHESNWRLLSLNHGRFRLALHSNNRACAQPANEWEWFADDYSLTSERCVSVYLPEKYIRNQPVGEKTNLFREFEVMLAVKRK